MAIKEKTDRRILRTKEAINKAFLELFSEKEFDHITINEISERANVNRGTVYLHYADKYDLLDRSIEDHLNRMFRLCALNRSDGDRVDLIGSLLPLFSYLEDNFLFFSTMLSNPKSSLFRERMLRIASDNIAAKLDGRDASTDRGLQLQVQFMASALYGVVEWWIAQKMPFPPREMADRVWKLFEKHQIYRGETE